MVRKTAVFISAVFLLKASSGFTQLPKGAPQTLSKCIACHTFDKGGVKKVGPNLFGVFGRQTSIEGGKWIWDEQNLDIFLKDPVEGVKKLSGNPDFTSKMRAIKVTDEKERKEIIDYLKTLK